MGRVFLGRSPGGRPVAVKVIRRDLAADPDFRQRFRREVAAARKVSGLYTAMVIDADVDAPEPWLATAYVEGPSLYEAVDQHGPLPLGSVLALTAGLAESLTAIHAAGVVHRDLKPSNVLLGRDGPYLIDFGISRAAESTSLTRAGFVIGSPGFMSPEQAEGGEVGPASDIFSLGAVLAFAASAQHPFGAGSTAALVYRVVYAPPNLDGVPEEIRPLIERCLAKDPSQRPDASELLREAEAAEPMANWLPEPITRVFPDYRPPVATPTPPSVVTPPPQAVTPPPEVVTPPPHAAEVPSEEVLTVTGMVVPAASEPELPPAAAGAEVLAAGAAVLAAQTAPPEAEPALSEAQTEHPEAETAAPAAKAAVPEAQTGPQADEAAAPEADTAVPVLAAAGAATAPAPIPGSEPHPAVEPLPPPWAEVPPRPRRRLARPLVLAAAAALILIGSAMTALALSGSPSHTSASHGVGTAAAPDTLGGAAPAGLATSSSAASASAARTAPHSSAASSKRPGAQPTTQAATTQAATTQAPTTAPTTSAPTQQPSPKPTPTHKPTPQPTHAAALSVSVSGGSEDSCGAIGSLHPNQGASVSFTFADQSSANIGIAYIDSSGAVVGVATVGPGGVYTAGTYVGAYWVVQNSGGGCLAVVGVNGSGQATVT